MTKRIFTTLALLAMTLALARGQAFDAMRRTTTFTNTDLMLTQTNSAGSAGQKFTAAITWSNVIETLKSFNNWPSGLGTLTTIKTNAGTVSSVASSLAFIEGTNIVLRATNAAGVTTVQINSAGGSGSGDVTTTQLNTASNALVNLLVSYDTTTSNGLYALIIGGGITAATATNIAQFFATNSAIVTSNALLTTLVANDTTTSNGLFSVETTRNAAVSNALASLLVANDTTTSNGLITLHAMAFTNANQVWSNVVIVNPTANVLTNGILLTNAVKYAGTLASASRPVLVRIMPGTYGTPTNTLPSVMWAVDNVSTYWEPGAVWWSGTANGDVAWMFDDQTAARTNCVVLGYGRFFITNDSINVFYTDKESRIRFECLSMYVTDGVGGNSTASPFTWGSVTNEMDVTVNDYMESADYDAFYGALAAGQRLRLKAKTVRAIGDIFEFSDDSPQWGNVILDIDQAEQTATTGQASFLQMAGRVQARIGQIKVASTVSSMAANGATNGILQGAIIELPANGSRSVIQDNSGGSWHTGLWLRDCVLIGPTNVDALTLTNIATVPTILENTTIRPGWASTNWARGATPSNVKIVGGFNLDPYKPLGSQVTVISTNYLPSIRNIGTLVQHGVSFFSNTVTVVADVTVGGTINGDAGSFNSITAINQFNLPNGAGPFAPADGDLFFDNNYWAAGRGAFVTWDGTANVVVPTALQSDTPSNGQVLKFNTGGTFTWEDDNNSGGTGGTNFPAVLAQLGNTNLTLQAGKRTTHYFATNGNHGIDADLAAPASGHTFINIETNSAATNYTVTFYTNGVAATFYDIAEKTNNTSFAVPVGAVVETEFTWTGSQWLFKREAPSLVFAVDTAYYSMATGGVNNLTATLSPAYIPQASSMVLSNMVGLSSTVFTNVPLGGTNISVRIAGGTNFIDTTGQLNNWANFTTNVISSTATADAKSQLIASNALWLPTISIAKFATNAAWNINVPLGGSVNAITNTLGGSTANLWITNVVDGGFFVARILVDGTARTVSVTNASGLTLKVISTNGFSVLTLPQVPVTASKVATIMGRAWVVAGTTNVDLWANVEQ